MDYNFERSVGRLTKDVSHLTGKLLHHKFKEANLNVDVTEWIILTYLINLGELTQNKLAQQTGRDKVAIKRAIDKLEEKKLARRKKNKLDRRFNKVTLSKKGRETYPLLKEKAEETIQLAYGELDWEQIKACLDTLGQFKQNLEAGLAVYQSPASAETNMPG